MREVPIDGLFGASSRGVRGNHKYCTCGHAHGVIVTFTSGDKDFPFLHCRLFFIQSPLSNLKTKSGREPVRLAWLEYYIYIVYQC